jgi:hypothetical protein
VSRILVTGSRDWTDLSALTFALGWTYGHLQARGLGPAGAVLVHGACPTGADAMADAVWTGQNMPVERHPADWDTHLRRAGFIRNAEMVALGADVCLAFIRNGSNGATMTARLAEAAGIRTIIFRA